MHMLWNIADLSELALKSPGRSVKQGGVVSANVFGPLVNWVHGHLLKVPSQGINII